MNMYPSLQETSSVDGFSKDILLWKVHMLQKAAAYANSRLHAVKAEVLVLARFVSFFGFHSIDALC